MVQKSRQKRFVTKLLRIVIPQYDQSNAPPIATSSGLFPQEAGEKSWGQGWPYCNTVVIRKWKESWKKLNMNKLATRTSFRPLHGLTKDWSRKHLYSGQFTFSKISWCQFEVLQRRIQDFFRRGCTRLLLYFNTNKPHSFFFFAEYQLY